MERFLGGRVEKILPVAALLEFSRKRGHEKETITQSLNFTLAVLGPETS
jgi:hypothetical protein